MSEIREWARSQGLEIGDRGMIPYDILEAYKDAHGLGLQDTEDPFILVEPEPELELVEPRSQIKLTLAEWLELRQELVQHIDACTTPEEGAEKILLAGWLRG
jgi:hypothetical protein